MKKPVTNAIFFKGRTEKIQHRCLERPLHCRKVESDQVNGHEDKDVCAVKELKIIRHWKEGGGKSDPVSRSQGDKNVFVYKLVQHFSNVTVRKCLVSANRMLCTEQDFRVNY